MPDVTPKKVELVKISFEVNDVRRYAIPAGFFPQRFFFSPIDSVDKIWADSHELNLSTGKWITLNDIFDVPNKITVQEENVWTDSLTSNVYLNFWPGGLIEFDAHKKTFRNLHLPYAYSFLALKDVIYFGSAHGLYTYNRGADSVKRSSNFPRGISVYRIEKLSREGVLRLGTSNDDIIYHIQDSKLDTIPRRPVTSYKDQSEIFPKLLLPGYYSPDRIIEDDTITWIYNQAGIYIKQGENIFHVTQLDSGLLQQMRIDSRHLYLLFNRQFVILNKAAVFRNAERFDAESYRTELNAVTSFYQIEYQSLQKKISKIDSLQNVLRNSVHPDIRSRAENLNNSIHAFDDNLRPEIELAIKKGSFPEKFKKSVFHSLIQYYTKQGNLDKAAYYYNKLHTILPRDTEQNSALALFIRVKASTDSINKLSLDADKKLYLRTLEREKLMHTGWFGESYLDDTIVADSYQQLLDTYPNSEFADNAAFYLLRRKYVSEEGMLYSLEADEEYQRFIERYPLSELKVSASLEIVDMCLGSGRQGEARMNMLRRAKAELSRLSTKDMTELQKERFLHYKSTVETELNSNQGIGH